MVIVIYRTLREDIIKFTLQIHNIVWPSLHQPQLSDVHQHFTFRVKLTLRQIQTSSQYSRIGFILNITTIFPFLKLK